MDDWTKEPIKPETVDMTYNEKHVKKRALDAQRTLKFVVAHPEGVTATECTEAGISTYPFPRLQKLGVIKGYQVREPERGNRAFHWLWKAVIMDE